MTCPNCSREFDPAAAHCVCGYVLTDRLPANTGATYSLGATPLRPRRSLGVTITGWTSICCGFVSLLLLLLISSEPLTRLPGLSLWFGVVIYGGLGIAGLVVGIGLLRLYEWARISTLIFSCLLFYSGFLAIFTGLLAPPLEPEVTSGMLILIAALALLMQCAGVFWLYYFLKQNVRAQFVPDGKPYRRPASVIAIAALSLGGSAIGLREILGAVSVAIILGTAVSGWPGSLIVGVEIALAAC